MVTNTDKWAKKKRRGTVHKDFKQIPVKRVDGSFFSVYSTYKKNSYELSIDIYTHPAWTRKSNYIDTRSGEVANFTKKFGTVNIGALLKKK